ncbi:prepilin peptidase, partial [Pseudonocardia sp.]|uniref:prepilin peptidase n=2 Tax=Pseudonocardia sp. TaxID=60912 RepID=UPI003D0E99C8
PVAANTSIIDVMGTYGTGVQGALPVLLAAPAGAAAGPWLRAAIVRHTVAAPGARRSGCACCAAPLGAPSVSGRARCCGQPVGPPAWSVELVAALGCGVVVAARAGPAAVLGCWVVLCGIVLVAVDAAVHRLPAPLTATTAAGAGTALLLTAGHDPAAAVRAVVAGVVAAGVLVVLRAVTRGGIGGGDCALAPGLGAAVGRDGWAALVLAGVTTTVLGAVHAVAAAVVAGRARGVEVPFGPAMVGGALAVVAGAGPPG